ncbi:MmgE/PrpD family protein [Jiangella asiatica]|uniref:MmgE/PrpD family protein n=1 Tax=Jiangella asiatica TaxID=2530372 RepID=A0A4R5DA60_9ACTN|nr:MmgE/PrpD family protein [Jiangella asiatica]TDE07445.1 MmgE/PrpD family protein [Jiangella asiatica]
MTIGRPAHQPSTTSNDGTVAVARHIAAAAERELPAPTVAAAKRAVLDAFVAMISGSRLEAGRLARRYVASYGSRGEASLVGDGGLVRPELAALANAMSAHADETDDVHDLARMHPGASIVPAALALAETEARSGRDLLRAVVLGYDVGCAVSVAAWGSLEAMQKSYRSPHSLAQPFGAAAAAASLAGLSHDQVVHVLAYAADQASGFTSFYRDERHLEKAFSSAGMQAHSGVRAVELVRHGFTAVDDVLDGTPSVFDVFGAGGSAAAMVDALAGQHYVELTDLKRYPVGMPIQAAAEATEYLLAERPFGPADVVALTCRLPPHGARIVDGRHMPDIHLQYVLAVIVADGGLTFESAHDYARRRGADISALMERIELLPDPGLDGVIDGHLSSRRAVVEVRLRDGTRLERRVTAARGSRLRPLDWDEVCAKARRVLGGGIGPDAVDALCAAVAGLEQVADVRQLRPVLTPAPR